MGPKPAPERRDTGDTPPDSLPPIERDVPEDLRRRDPPDVMPPDSLPRPDEDVRATGRHGSPDGGNDQHPVHDEDLEDRDPEDYERELATARSRL
jgi:hypothetical protein